MRLSRNMGRDPSKRYDFAKGQKTGCAETIKNLNLSCSFQTSLCLFAV